MLACPDTPDNAPADAGGPAGVPPADQRGWAARAGALGRGWHRRLTDDGRAEQGAEGQAGAWSDPSKTPNHPDPPRKVRASRADVADAGPDLAFGVEFTDHMMTMEWDRAAGFAAPQIVQHGPLALDPACPGLNYGAQCFEGPLYWTHALWTACDAACVSTPMPPCPRARRIDMHVGRDEGLQRRGGQGPDVPARPCAAPILLSACPLLAHLPLIRKLEENV